MVYIILYLLLDKEKKTFLKKVLFIGGSKSNYIKPEYYPAIESYFPNHQIEIIQGASHWVHADKPQEFIEILSHYLSCNKV
jgi:esterase